MQKILITPDNMPEITFKFVKMDRETSEVFMQLGFGRNEDFKKLLSQQIAMAKETAGIIAIVHKRYQHYKEEFKLPDLDDKVLILIDLFANGNPGKAIIMLIDLCGTYKDKKEITMDDFVNKYPFGFYDMDTMINIGDNYIKTGKVLFSEMY